MSKLSEFLKVLNGVSLVTKTQLKLLQTQYKPPITTTVHSFVKDFSQKFGQVSCKATQTYKQEGEYDDLFTQQESGNIFYNQFGTEMQNEMKTHQSPSEMMKETMHQNTYNASMKELENEIKAMQSTVDEIKKQIEMLLILQQKQGIQTKETESIQEEKQKNEMESEKKEEVKKTEIPPKPQYNPNLYVTDTKKLTPKKVPATSLSRAFHFGNLGLKIGASAAGEYIKQSIGLKEKTSILLTEANIQRLTDTLCRMRGL